MKHLFILYAVACAMTVISCGKKNRSGNLGCKTRQYKVFHCILDNQISYGRQYAEYMCNNQFFEDKCYRD